MCTPEAITVAVTLAPAATAGAPPSIRIAVNGPPAPAAAIPDAASLARRGQRQRLVGPAIGRTLDPCHRIGLVDPQKGGARRPPTACPRRRRRRRAGSSSPPAARRAASESPATPSRRSTSDSSQAAPAGAGLADRRAVDRDGVAADAREWLRRRRGDRRGRCREMPRGRSSRETAGARHGPAVRRRSASVAPSGAPCAPLPSSSQTSAV